MAAAVAAALPMKLRRFSWFIVSSLSVGSHGKQ
jgi:hypothetical protein